MKAWKDRKAQAGAIVTCHAAAASVAATARAAFRQPRNSALGYGNGHGPWLMAKAPGSQAHGPQARLMAHGGHGPWFISKGFGSTIQAANNENGVLWRPRTSERF